MELKAKLASSSDADALDFILSLTEAQQKDLIVELSMDAGSADDLSRYMGFIEKLTNETVRLSSDGESVIGRAAPTTSAVEFVEVDDKLTREIEEAKYKDEDTPIYPSGKLPPNAAEAGGCGCGPGGGCSVM
jgi:hypothetical protein